MLVIACARLSFILICTLMLCSIGGFSVIRLDIEEENDIKWEVNDDNIKLIIFVSSTANENEAEKGIDIKGWQGKGEERRESVAGHMSEWKRIECER